MIKKFIKDYWCASPYWKTCQLDCGDCNMLRKKFNKKFFQISEDYGQKENKERKK